VDPKECYEEPIDEGDGVYCVCGVETLEEDQGSHDRCRCECDIVNGVDTIAPELATHMTRRSRGGEG